MIVKNICIFIARIFRIFYLIEKYRILDPYKMYFRKDFLIFRGFFRLIILPHKIFFQSKESWDNRLKNFIYDMGPVFIKFAQTLSSSPSILGSEISLILRSVQDKLPPFENSVFVKKFEKFFHKKVEDVFLAFDYKVISSASVAQVYKARLKNGECVAVKCLRPNILLKYKQDIDFLEILYKIFSKLFSNLIEKTRRLKFQETIVFFRNIMNAELNLVQEAYSADKIRDNFFGDQDLYIPKIYKDFVSSDILVLEWVEGFSIYEHAKIIQAGINLQDVICRFVKIFFDQAYRDGFFHADPHPGNILIEKETGKIILLDFGIVSVLKEKDRIGIAEILYGFLKRDYLLVAQVHKKLGYIASDVDLDLFAYSCKLVAEPILDDSNGLSLNALLYNLFQITEKFGMQTQVELLMLQKTLVMIEGISRILGAKDNIWYLIKPHIKKWAINNISFEAKIVKLIRDSVNFLLRSI